MCTLSIIPLRIDGQLGMRVVVNRDESHDRPQAVPPRWRSLDHTPELRAIWPTDPQAGGTWVGASERGLVLCLLNRNLEPAPLLPANMVSRGAIIPRVIDAGTADEAIARVEELALSAFAPFRLVAAHVGASGVTVRSATWNLEDLELDSSHVAPVCFASSGLGDSKVSRRVELFRELLADDGPTREAQDRFHAHVWPARRELSVMMHREDARTVSVTRVEVFGQTSGRAHVVMHHRPVLVPALVPTLGTALSPAHAGVARSVGRAVGRE
jgi:uncharacterized protein with NRDE domain